MKTLRMVAVLSILLVVAGCATTTTTRTHPTLEEQLHHVNSVVIAPPRVEIEYVTLTGENERLTDQEEIIRAQLINIAEVELRNHGYEIVEFDFDKAIENDEELAYTVTQIREGFDKAKEDLQFGKQISEEQANKLQISLGEAANIVAAESGADAILLMRYAGFDKSGGHVAKDVGTTLLVGILTMGQVLMTSPTSGAMTEVALIDGITGDVLWADVKGGYLNAAVAAHAMDTLPHDVDPGLEKAQPGQTETVVPDKETGS
jgi:hypothetical protein